MNYYQVLGLNRKDNPTKDDIKKAYRKLAKEWHPDRNKSEEATSKFQEIQKAYDTLYDDNKRKEYDMELDGFNWNNLFNNNGSSSNANSNAGPSFNPDDLFKDLFSFINTNKSQQNKKKSNQEFNFSGDDNFSFFNRDAGAGRASASNTNKSEFAEQLDIKQEIKIPLDIAINGGEHLVQIDTNNSVNILCSNCNGSGYSLSSGNIQKCEFCHGTGKVNNYSNSEIKKFQIKIPANITNGKVIKLAGKGKQSILQNKIGDLLLTVKIDDFENYTLDEHNNIINHVYYTLNDLLTGKLNVNTLRKNKTTNEFEFVSISIPQNVTNKTKIRLKGKGLIPDKTDMYVMLSDFKMSDILNLSEEEKQKILNIIK